MLCRVSQWRMLHPVALSCPALANNNNLSVICSLTELSKPTSKVKAGSAQAKIYPINANRYPLFGSCFKAENSIRGRYCLSMIFSDLPSPAEASNETTNRCLGFAQAGNRYPLFGIMLRISRASTSPPASKRPGNLRSRSWSRGNRTRPSDRNDRRRCRR